MPQLSVHLLQLKIPHATTKTGTTKFKKKYFFKIKKIKAGGSHKRGDKRAHSSPSVPFLWECDFPLWVMDVGIRVLHLFKTQSN